MGMSLPWSLTPPARRLQRVFQLRFGSLYTRPLSKYQNFHFSAYAAQGPTHYDTLNLPHTATASEIKRLIQTCSIFHLGANLKVRRYYELSKAHHPDRNPKDSNAATRFARLSNAYGVIGNSVKREKYDQDIARRHGVKCQKECGPAGGRPACGLSRRRTQFYGPPPSFFRDTGLRTGGRAVRTAQSGSTTTGVGGFGAQSGRNDDVPHFDFERHRAQQERRRRPISQAEFDFATSGIIVPLIGVASLLLVAIAISSRDSRVVGARKQSNET